MVRVRRSFVRVFGYVRLLSPLHHTHGRRKAGGQDMHIYLSEKPRHGAASVARAAALGPPDPFPCTGEHGGGRERRSWAVEPRRRAAAPRPEPPQPVPRLRWAHFDAAPPPTAAVGGARRGLSLRFPPLTAGCDFIQGCPGLSSSSSASSLPQKQAWRKEAQMGCGPWSRHWGVTVAGRGLQGRVARARRAAARRDQDLAPALGADAGLRRHKLLQVPVVGHAHLRPPHDGAAGLPPRTTALHRGCSAPPLALHCCSAPLRRSKRPSQCSTTTLGRSPRPSTRRWSPRC